MRNNPSQFVPRGVVSLTGALEPG